MKKIVKSEKGIKEVTKKDRSVHNYLPNFVHLYLNERFLEILKESEGNRKKIIKLTERVKVDLKEKLRELAKEVEKAH